MTWNQLKDWIEHNVYDPNHKVNVWFDPQDGKALSPMKLESANLGDKGPHLTVANLGA